MMTISYILKMHVVFTALFLMYYIFLRKNKFLALNRFIMIGILLAAFTLPIVQTLPIESFNISRLRLPVTAGNVFPQLSVNEYSIQPAMHSAKAVQKTNYALLAVVAYFVVAVVLLVAYLSDLCRVFDVIRLSRRHKFGALTYCKPAVSTAPFSFFRYIVIDKSALSPEEYRNIMMHERAHARQLHSLDVLLSDIACMLFWINPLIYLYRRELKINLEFLADDAALNSGIDAGTYQMNLLRHSGILASYRTVNAFFSSKIKARIVMINTPRPNIRDSYKYLWLLALGLILSALVGFQKKQPIVKQESIMRYESVAAKTESLAPVRQAVVEMGNCYQNNKQPSPFSKAPKVQQENLNVYIDARTDTVKFNLAPDSTGRRFHGIYAVADKIFTDDEIRAAIKQNGRLEMILPSRPVLGTYSANNSSAIKKWGNRARMGVVFVRARSGIPVQ